MARVLGFGSALLDLLAHVPESFLDAVPGDKGGMVLVEPDEQQRLVSALAGPPQTAPGGSAANTVVGLAQLGLPARLLAKTGSDPAGDGYRQHLLAAGVETSALKRCTDLPTGTCLSLVTPDGERTLRTCLGAAATISPGDIEPTDLQGCSHVLMEGYMLHNRPASLHVLRLAREAGCTICLDLASPEVVRATGQELPALLDAYADVVFANAEEATAFSNREDPEAALAALGRHCRVAVVKLGPQGALLRCAGEQARVAAERVPVRDTTGAGDLWAAGFLYGHLQGCPLAVAGRMGAAVAAAVVQVLGATLPSNTWAELRARLEAMRGDR
jgi:sugar/nucleoside kinase (ribokinase family)